MVRVLTTGIYSAWQPLKEFALSNAYLNCVACAFLLTALSKIATYGLFPSTLRLATESTGVPIKYFFFVSAVELAFAIWIFMPKRFHLYLHEAIVALMTCFGAYRLFFSAEACGCLVNPALIPKDLGSTLSFFSMAMTLLVALFSITNILVSRPEMEIVTDG